MSNIGIADCDPTLSTLSLLERLSTPDTVWPLFAKCIDKLHPIYPSIPKTRVLIMDSTKDDLLKGAYKNSNVS
jgi:hypothetical protein